MRSAVLSAEAPIEISRLGLGCWAFGGGDWAFGWGPQDDHDSVATIRSAVARGIDWLDTAPVYGLGRAESVVAAALSDIPRSERPRVFTKCGLRWTPGGKVRHRLEPDSIREEVEASLRRLGLETIDLYQIHWPSYPPGSPAPGLESAWETLAALVRDGKVRYVGVSNFDREQLDRVRKIAPVASLQPPYSLIRRDAESDLLPYCEEHGIGVIAYSPLGSGLLTGAMTRERASALPDSDWRKRRSLDFQDPRLSEHLALVERLREAGRRVGASPAQLAIRWVLRSPAVTGAIVGARRPEQLEEVVGAMELELDEGVLAPL